MKRLLIFLLFSLFAYGKSIESYIVNLYINNTGKTAVTEQILYNFETERRHGIYRDIPLNSTRIKDVKVSRNNTPVKYETMVKSYNGHKFLRIKIGSANYYVTGLQEYKISYKIDGYTVRKNGNKNEISIDAIGTGWKIPIKMARIMVHLPPVLKNRVAIKVYRGEFGSSLTIPYKIVNGNIVIETQNLAPHSGLTVSLNFNPNLIKVSKKPNDKYYENPIYYLFLAPILALFYYFGKKFNIMENLGSIAVKYRPPKEITVLEAGLLKDNFVDFKELKPAIIELANLGYIKFIDNNGDTLLEKQDKDISSLTNDQKMLLDAIFKGVEVVYTTDLKIKKEDVENLRNILHNSLVDKGFFARSVREARDGFAIALAGVGLLSISAFIYYIAKDTGYEFVFPVAISMIFIIVGAGMLVNNIKNGEFFGSIFAVAWIGFSSLFLFAATNSINIGVSILLFVLIVALGGFFIYKRINTLTIKGEMQKRYLFGLKEFIARANKDKIDYFLQEDKHYLDKLLPYAILFGLNKHWLKLYEEMNVDLPDWYAGDINTFGTDLDFGVTDFDTSSISSSPSINSGDFSDFGGGFGDFSGGGFGGGGGGDW